MGEKILKSVFGEVFYLEEISLQVGERMEEVKSGAAETRINVWDVCVLWRICVK